MYHFISLFLATSHNFLSLQSYIKFLSKTSNNIAVITQEEFETEILPNPNLTMAIPYLGKFSVAKLPEKKMYQGTLWGMPPLPPASKPTTYKVDEYKRGSKTVSGYERQITAKAKGKRTKTKSIKSKKKAGKSEHCVYLEVPDDCKESVQLAHTLHIQEMKNLFNSFKK